MARWTIARKIAVAACLVVLIPLVVAALALMQVELSLVDSIIEQHLEEQESGIDRLAGERGGVVRDHAVLMARVAAMAGGEPLARGDLAALNGLLADLVHLPEIPAALARDAQGRTVAAAWEEGGRVKTGTGLPAGFTTGTISRMEAAVKSSGRAVGSMVVFHTDTMTSQRVSQMKRAASEAAGRLRQTARERLKRVFVSQGVGLLGILAALSAGLMLLVRRMVARPISQVAEMARRLSQLDVTGDLSTNRHDEIGALYAAVNEMAERLRQVLGQVRRAGIQVNSSATQLAASAKEQEATMKAQADSTDNAVQSVKRIAQTSSELLTTMNQVATMSEETAGFAATGKKDLSGMESAMRNMEKASATISGRLNAISDKAENITSVVDTITKVADQTNLLSLNAAIEAEKAGEYGRGFTVVAREIRRLADQTAIATLDIGQMVAQMQQAVTAGVLEMDKFMGEVKDAVHTVEGISRQLSRIINQVQALSPNFEAVNTSMGRQSESAEAIRHLMEDLNEQMRQTSNSLYESYMSIE
ncbi:MAG: methyl-accepting chemotaxis protein, partial [Pseudomonadota bacterium]